MCVDDDVRLRCGGSTTCVSLVFVRVGGSAYTRPDPLSFPLCHQTIRDNHYRLPTAHARSMRPNSRQPTRRPDIARISIPLTRRNTTTPPITAIPLTTSTSCQLSSATEASDVPRYSAPGTGTDGPREVLTYPTDWSVLQLPTDEARGGGTLNSRGTHLPTMARTRGPAPDTFQVAIKHETRSFTYWRWMIHCGSEPGEHEPAYLHQIFETWFQSPTYW